MCGIVGYWSDALNGNTAIIDASIQKIIHRGPDQQHYKIYEKGVLGAARLRIIGIDSGTQPISDEQGNVLVFNGAIYNFNELGAENQIQSNSDTETLFQLLKKFGQGIIPELNGMFAFAYYDSVKKTLLLARDRLGQKPLYYYHQNEKLFFASELSALKCLLKDEIKLSVNPDAIYQYLSFSNVPEPSTIYKNVYALQAGSIIQFKGESLTSNRYWDLDFEPKAATSMKEVLEQTSTLIRDSIKKRLISDVPIGLFLSGGIDSSVIAYELSKLSKSIDCYTVEYPDQTSQNESAIAQKTARNFGLKHHSIPIAYNAEATLLKYLDSAGQPHADSSAIPMMAITKAASEQVKVMISGDGGDELFGGYRRYFMAQNEKRFRFLSLFSQLFRSENRRSRIGFLSRMARIANTSWPEKYLAYTTDMFKKDELEVLWNQDNPINFQQSLEVILALDNPSLNSLDRLIQLDISLNFKSGILSKYDRTSMLHSIEARSPFLDHRLFESISKLPSSYKVNGTTHKWLLKSLYSNKLPKEVLQHKKTSFEAPLDIWMKKDLSNLFKESIFNSNAKIYDYLDKDRLRKYIESDSRNTKRNDRYNHYALMVLEIWLQKHT